MKKNYEKKSAKQNWAIAQLSCEIFFFFVLQERGLEKKNYIAIVMQEKGVVGWFVLQCEEYCKKKGICIAIQSVYCKWERLEWLLKIVLQNNYCIAGWEAWLGTKKMYCNTRYCIVTEAARSTDDCIAIQLLYCNLCRLQ